MERDELFKVIAGHLHDCQKSAAAHNRCAQVIRKKYLEQPDVTADVILIMVAKVLQVPKKESNVERVVKFLGKLAKDISIAEKTLFKRKGKRISLDNQFSSSQEEASSSQRSVGDAKDDEQSFRYVLLRFLLQFCESHDKTVRWRGCQVIGVVCAAIAPAKFIGPDMKASIVHAMMERTHDRMPQIRATAIRVLGHVLHADSEDDDEILQRLKRLMEHDSHQEVRKAAVQCFPVSGQSLSRMLDRTRDVNPDVRKAAYRSLAQCSPIIFGEDHLCEALCSGLQDRDTAVQAACVKMVQAWLKDATVLNIVTFMNAEDHEATTELLLRRLLEEGSLGAVTAPSSSASELFSPALALIWRVSVEPEEVDETAVSLEDLIHLIRKAVAEESYFVLKQFLLASLKMVQYESEHFRRQYSVCLRKLLLEEERLPVVSQQLCMDALSKIHTNDADFIQVHLEILADIVEPLDDEDDEEGDEDDEDELPGFVARDPVNSRSAEVHLRALTMVEKILSLTNLDSSHPGIAGLLDAVIIPSVQHKNVEVRAKSLKCFGLYCLMDMAMAKSNLCLFVQAANRDKPAMQRVAAQTLFDFLTRFDPVELLQVEEAWPEKLKRDVLTQGRKPGAEDRAKEDSSFTMLTLVKFLRHADADLRTVAVEGFAKLLLNNFVTDASILSILITLYFHPATEASSQLVQCLGAFFPAYGMGGEDHQVCLEECFVPTIRRILTASKYSPLRKVPVDKVAQFILQHISMGLNRTKSVHHDLLAADLADELYAMGAYVSEEGKQLCKVICKMNISGEDKQVVERLRNATIHLARRTKDKTLQRSLQSLHKKLNSMCPGGAGSKRRSPTADKELDEPRKRRAKKAITLELETESSDDEVEPVGEMSRQSDDDDDDVSALPKKRKRPTGQPSVFSKRRKLAETSVRDPNVADHLEGTQVEGAQCNAVIAFSGFGEADAVYNFVFLKKLVSQAKSFGAQVILGNLMAPEVTHLVSPPNRKTMKTIIASLSSKWVVDPAWITDSFEGGVVLPEDSYGQRLTERPFKEKQVHISVQFMEENPNKQFSPALFKTLICDLGGGKIIRTPKGADMILCGRIMKQRHRGSSKYLDWKDWFALLQPAA